MNVPTQNHRRAINFDFKVDGLKKVFGEANYEIAYKKIRRYFEENDFFHRQGSSYYSFAEFTDPQVVRFIGKTVKHFPWLPDCVTCFDVTNIGSLYDLTELIQRAEKIEDHILADYKKGYCDKHLLAEESNSLDTFSTGMEIHQRAINFDLKVDVLRKVFGEEHYENGYMKLRRFFEKNGFIHRQGSGYYSSSPLTDPQVLKLIGKAVKKLPWLNDSINRCDVTNIGTTYDLIPYMIALSRDKNYELTIIQQNNGLSLEVILNDAQKKTQINDANHPQKSKTLPKDKSKSR